MNRLSEPLLAFPFLASPVLSSPFRYNLIIPRYKNQMPVDLTVPSGNQTAPQQPTGGSNTPNAATQQAIDTTAKSKLRQKNRKANSFEIGIPGPLLSLESATCYNMQGFTPNSETQKYVLGQVEFQFKGGSGGSKTRIIFYPALTF